MDETKKRDYKAEYKKFQSSTKAKKYRAELNKYNRKKGTYGNGDGKDASHKGGKIVGFEAQSKNRGRAEKSRLKKETVMSKKIYEVKIGRYDIGMGYKGNGLTIWNRNVEKAGDYKNIAHIDNNGKITNYEKRQPKEVTAFIQKTAQAMKDKPKGESVTENKLVGMAIGIAKKMGGDMTNAIKKIEKISKGLSKQKAVKDALRQANESVNEQEMSIKDAFKDLAKKHGGTKALDILTSVLAPMGFEDPKNKKEFQKKLLKKMKEGLGDRISKISKKYAKGQKKSKKALKNKKGPYQEEMNETPYELGGMKVYSKSDGLKKVKSMQKTDGAKIYKVTKTKTKLYDKYPVTMYNLHTKNKNHSTNSNPYGLDMMRGVYLIPVKESVNEDVWTAKITKAVKQIDKDWYKLIAKKGIEPYSHEASRLWRSAGFYDRMRKAFGKDESVNERMDKRQAAETLKQLGGNKFIMMTGAKNFAFGSNGLSFKIGRNAKAVNYVVIDLNGKDLYDMKFQKGTRVLNKVNDVYNDQLQKMFTKYTGMYTSLGTMGR